MGLGLSDDEIAMLKAQTEGWIIGLQLAALSLKDTSGTERPIHRISGDDRYIADYLIGEVLARQPESLQQFLLKTSILNRLSADLCNAVAEIENSQPILETLEKSNLFVVPLDNTREWYRYHHLFAEMLRFRLEHRYVGLLPDLYQQAFDWHKAQGLLEEAVRYALKGQMYAQAADIVEEVGYQTYWQNRAHTVWKWLKALPDDLLQSRPQLRIFYAYTQINQGKVEEAEHILGSLNRHLVEHPRPTQAENLVLEGKEKALRTAIAYHRYLDGALGSRLASRALDVLPYDCYFDRCVAAFHGGGALILLGELKQAREYLTEGLILSRLTGTPVNRLLILSNLGHLELTAGALHRAHDYFQEACQFAQEINARQGNTFSNALAGLGHLYYE